RCSSVIVIPAHTFGSDALCAGAFLFGSQTGLGVLRSLSRVGQGGCPMFWTLFDITSAAMVLVVVVIGLFVLAMLLGLRGASRYAFHGAGYGEQQRRVP